MFCPFLAFIHLLFFFISLIASTVASKKYPLQFRHKVLPEISFLPPASMTPVSSRTTIADPATSDKPVKQSQSKNADFKILLPKDFGLLPVPRRLQYDPAKPFHFGLLLNIAFGLASTFGECFNFPPFLGHLIG